VFAYEDLANFHGTIEKPTTTRFHGFDVYKAGPWNQGPVLLQTLNILEGVDLKSAGANSAEYLHQVHEAIKLAYDDRNAYYGDPAFSTVPIAGLLSRPHAAERRKLIGPRASLAHRPGDPFAFDPDVKAPASRYVPHSQGRRRRAKAAIRRASTSSTRTATCSAPRPARAGCSAARSSPATRGTAFQPHAGVRPRSAQPKPCWPAANGRGRL